MYSAFIPIMTSTYTSGSSRKTEHLNTATTSYFLLFFCSVVHFCDVLDKCRKRCSQLISIGAVVRTQTVRRCLFLRIDHMLTWLYQGKLKIRTSAQFETSSEQLLWQRLSRASQKCPTWTKALWIDEVMTIWAKKKKWVCLKCDVDQK